MKKNSSPTIADAARQAGGSLATVSRVLSGASPVTFLVAGRKTLPSCADSD